MTKRKKMDGKGQVILQPETVEVAQFRMPHFLLNHNLGCGWGVDEMRRLQNCCEEEEKEKEKQ